MPDVELDWYAVNGIGLVTYEIHIDTNSQFQNPVSFTSPTSAYTTENLNFGEIYFWRVRATDDMGTSEWSAIHSFTVFNNISLHKPTNGIVGVAPNVQLIWKNRQGSKYITGITYYEIQLSLDSNFTTIDFADSIAYGTFPADTNFYYKQAEYLLFNSTYYWRVRAKHETDACDWSEVWSFITVEGVSLVSPADSATDQHVTTILEWEEITGIDNYIFQLCTNPTFVFPSMTGIVDNIYIGVVISELTFGETYYWRVKATHPLDTTTWSEIRNFEIINTVNLISPAQGDTAGLNPLLKWEHIYGIEQYELHYWSEDNSTMEIEFMDIPEFQIYKPLDIGMNYNWKVRAYRNSDTTEWSETRTFLSQASQGYGNLFLNKENIAIFPNPTNGLVTIELNTLGQKTIQISVVDLLGKTVLENTFTFDQGLIKKTINLDHLNNGLYLIRLQSGGKLYTEKLVIDK
jgi:hypothetical protein